MKKVSRGQKLLLAFMSVLLVFALAACGGDKKTEESAKTEKTTEEAAPETNKAFAAAEKGLMDSLAPLPKKDTGKKIAALEISLTNPFWITVEEGYKDAAKEYGVDVEVFAADSEDDAVGQLDILNSLISKKYDGLAVSAINPQNLIPGVAAANKANIPVVAVGSPLDEKAAKEANAKVEAYITSNYEEQGRLGGEFIAKKIGSGKVAIIEGLSGANQGEARKRGAEKAFKDAGLEVVSIQPGDWDSQKAYDITTTLMEANPDLKGIFCANDIMGLAAVEALKAKDKKADVMVVSVDFIEEAKKSIVDGELDGSVAMSPYLFGKGGLILTLKALEGHELSEDIYMTPLGLINADNVDEYDGWK